MDPEQLEALTSGHLGMPAHAAVRVEAFLARDLQPATEPTPATSAKVVSLAFG